MIHVGSLHIATTAALGNDTGMIRVFYLHAPVTIQPVVDIHASLGVVQRGDFSVRPPGN
jgi:hypothetical protein